MSPEELEQAILKQPGDLTHRQKLKNIDGRLSPKDYELKYGTQRQNLTREAKRRNMSPEELEQAILKQPGDLTHRQKLKNIPGLKPRPGRKPGVKNKKKAAPKADPKPKAKLSVKDYKITYGTRRDNMARDAGRRDMSREELEQAVLKQPENLTYRQKLKNIPGLKPKPGRKPGVKNKKKAAPKVEPKEPKLIVKPEVKPYDTQKKWGVSKEEFAIDAKDRNLSLAEFRKKLEGDDIWGSYKERINWIKPKEVRTTTPPSTFKAPTDDALNKFNKAEPMNPWDDLFTTASKTGTDKATISKQMKKMLTNGELVDKGWNKKLPEANYKILQSIQERLAKTIKTATPESIKDAENYSVAIRAMRFRDKVRLEHEALKATGSSANKETITASYTTLKSAHAIVERALKALPKTTLTTDRQNIINQLRAINSTDADINHALLLKGLTGYP
jgi:hypothetical protein